MIEERSFRRGRPGGGYTLVELITVVLVFSVLAGIAVPRLRLGAVWAARADAAAQRLATDLRHTRTLAITHAARSPEGFSLVVPGPGRTYQIINEHDHTIVTTCTLAPGVQCSGPRRLAFGPLGSLREGSDTRLCLRTESKAYVIEVAPATGAVEWSPGSGKE